VKYKNISFEWYRISIVKGGI